MSAIVTTKKEVNEACLDFILMEMVETIVRTSDPSAETVNFKLERMGFRVGQKLGERFTKDRQSFPDALETIKFICKEFWITLFKKQVDNLRTNRKGVFVLQDNKFRWLAHISTSDPESAKVLSEKFLIFPCGIIRGMLSVVGINATVSAEISAVPACTFTIKEKVPS